MTFPSLRRRTAKSHHPACQSKTGSQAPMIPLRPEIGPYDQRPCSCTSAERMMAT